VRLAKATSGAALAAGAVVALKLVLPALILRWPFAAGWLNFALDSFDGDIIVPLGVAEPTYQLVDKAADYVTYVFMFLWGWRTPLRRAFTVTFLLRTVGQILFFATRNELALFFFPNLLEPLFLIYVTLGKLRGAAAAHDTYDRRRVVIWLFILVYKFQDEWITHVANVDRSHFVRSLLGR
jgi:hypothetical protein